MHNARRPRRSEAAADPTKPVSRPPVGLRGSFDQGQSGVSNRPREHISVIVPAHGRADLTEQVAGHLDGVESILVDNGSTLQSLHPLFDKVVSLERNEGFAKGCNEGAKAASGEILIFLNNDTIPKPGWADALSRCFDDPQVGIAGSLLLYPDRRVQHAGVALGIVNGVLTASNIGRGETLNREHCIPREVDAVTGACMAVRREAWTGFDEGYWNGYEDIDLCLTARALGWKVVYEPSSVVVHLESQSGPDRWSGVQDNVRRLQERWGEKWQLTPST